MRAVMALLVPFLILLTTGCATTPPSNSANLCEIFEEKRGWYKPAKASSKKWGSDIPTMMSIMYQESQFVHNARPGRKRILWVIPGPRKSNAMGYAQAKKETWREYGRDSGNGWAKRDRFNDAIDFIGWYNRKSLQRSRIPLNNAYDQYLAYHEGHGGYNRGTYRKKTWLLSTARQVETRASRYRQQLAGCEKRLERRGWRLFG